MSSKHRIVKDDDSQYDHELCDIDPGLHELASQLREDAVYLSEKYPPQEFAADLSAVQDRELDMADLGARLSTSVPLRAFPNDKPPRELMDRLNAMSAQRDRECAFRGKASADSRVSEIESNANHVIEHVRDIIDQHSDLLRQQWIKKALVAAAVFGFFCVASWGTLSYHSSLRLDNHRGDLNAPSSSYGIDSNYSATDQAKKGVN